MNKGTLYFRVIDFTTILLVSAFIAILMGVYQMLFYAMIFMMPYWLIVHFAFRFARADDFAVDCTQRAFAATGKAMVIFAPLALFTIAIYAGVKFEMAGKGDGAELILSYPAINLFCYLWMASLAIYLGAFNWIRWRASR